MPSTVSARGPLLWCRAPLLATVALLAGTLTHDAPRRGPPPAPGAARQPAGL